MIEGLVCWKCGASLAALPQPLGRVEVCPACGADLHACRLCRFYAPGVARDCREPVAEPVKDKERANFCDWFQPRPGAWAAADPRAAEGSRAELDALFGLPAQAGPQPGRSEADAAREALERLFKG
jgi:hypothetical protein